VAGDRAAVVAVVDPAAIGRDWSGPCTPLLGRAVGARVTDLVLVPEAGLSQLIRDWAYQAAQGSGRGVRIRVEIEDGVDAPGTVRLLVQAPDSSARELAARLASPTEPALAALRALLGGYRVEVIDVEGDAAGPPG
jgi:hypothetical protein